MQFFISHSSKDREWIDLVAKRIEDQGFSVYLAEYDLRPGESLNGKIQAAISGSDAFVVVLTENAAVSPIVREEIGYALALKKPLVPLVAPTIAQDVAAFGMLNGLEYVVFDIESSQDGLLALTDWVNHFAHEQQVARVNQLEAQRNAALLLLVLVGALAAVALIVASERR